MLRERKHSPKLYWKKMAQRGHHRGIKIVRVGGFIVPSVFRFWLGERDITVCQLTKSRGKVRPHLRQDDRIRALGSINTRIRGRKTQK